MDVRFCEGRNHRREAHVRAAGSARVRRARSSEARVRRIFFSLTQDLHGCDGPQGPETVNGCPVLRRQEPSPRGTRASCGFCQSLKCALLRSARQEDYFLLDTRLTWRSANLTLRITEGMPVAREEVQRPSAADFPEAD